MINIVFGKPGAGKTAFMVSRALEYLTPGAKNRDLLGACRNDVAAVNSLGYNRIGKAFMRRCKADFREYLAAVLAESSPPPPEDPPQDPEEPERSTALIAVNKGEIAVKGD